MRFGKTLATIVTLIILAGCAGTRTSESTGEFVDDVAISTKVKSKLLASPDTKGTAITVETFKGTVQLSGFVDTAMEKRKAEEIAAETDGVARVDNKITVKGS
jgi:osmotically-inducible protein OsmY